MTVTARITFVSRFAWLMWRALLVGWVLVAWAQVAMPQSGALDEVQAVISGPLTGHMARTVTKHLSSRPGVVLCRVDVSSRNLLMHVDDRFRLSEPSLEKLFAMHGLHLRCYRRGPRNPGPFRLLDPARCATPSPEK